MRPDLREQDLETLRKTFRRFPCIQRVRVFGSRAAGNARRASDIDLAVEAPDATPSEWSALQEALEETPIIYEIDCVRADALRNARMLEHIANEGVQIWP